MAASNEGELEMADFSGSEESLISEWATALRFRRRVPLGLLLRSMEQEAASEPAKGKAPGKDRGAGKVKDRTAGKPR
jgi:hypothetical protein